MLRRAGHVARLRFLVANWPGSKIRPSANARPRGAITSSAEGKWNNSVVSSGEMDFLKNWPARQRQKKITPVTALSARLRHNYPTGKCWTFFFFNTCAAGQTVRRFRAWRTCSNESTSMIDGIEIYNIGVQSMSMSSWVPIAVDDTVFTSSSQVASMNEWMNKVYLAARERDWTVYVVNYIDTS